MINHAAEFVAAARHILERMTVALDTPEVRILVRRIEAQKAYNARMSQRARSERPRKRPRR